MSSAQKRALETAPLIPKEGSPADISNADSAKVQQKLETLAKNLEKVSSHRKNFLDEVADALGAKKHGSNSRYVTIEAKNGKIVAIRLSNHNATVSTFDKHDEDEGISIVVSPRSNQGMNDDGNAHIVEFFYPEIAIRKAEGKPLAEIVRSIEQSLYSGEYKDTTGLAEVQEVNAGTTQSPSYQKANVSQAVFVSNARRAVEGIRQEKATPEQWLAMLQKQGGLKAGEDKWLGLSDWLKGQDKKSLTKQEVLDFIDQNQIQIEEVKYGKGLFSKNSKANLESELKEGIAKGKPIDDVLLRWDFVFDDNKWYEYHDKRFTVDEDGNIHTEEELLEPINDTRLAYTTKGLENKREIALTVPTIEPWNEGDAIHFGDAGEGRAVAWIRFGETTDADGNRTLVIDEIQSKRHQEGRERGYTGSFYLTEEQWVLVSKWLAAEDVIKRGQEAIQRVSGKRLEEERKNIQEAEDVKRELVERYGEAKINKWVNMAGKAGSIPDAPFDKNWHELAMKRMLRYAAENGYDKVAWTTGEQQAKRYDIGDAVERIISYDFPEAADLDGRKSKKIEIRLKDSGTMTMRVDQNGKVIEGRSETEGKMLSDIVGKEIAKSIMNGDGRDGSIFDANRDIPAKIIDGDGLRIGGEGMKGFYDRMLPSFVNKYVKKWGAKVGEVELPDIGDQTYRLNSEGKMKRGLSMWSVDVTPEMKRDVMQGQPMFHRVYHGSAADFDRFDHSHMGEGEGAQAFGWGTYVTEVEGIGKTYAEQASRKQEPKYKGLSPAAITGLGGDVNNSLGITNKAQLEALAHITASLKYGYGDPVRMIRAHAEYIEDRIKRKEREARRLSEEARYESGEKKERLERRVQRRQESLAEDRALLGFVRSLNPHDFEGWTKKYNPTLYTVEIPEDKESYYLDYTAKMRDQQDILAMVDDYMSRNEVAGFKWKRQVVDERIQYRAGNRLITLTPNQSGADLYEEFSAAFGARPASEILHRAGLTGIKYPAEYTSGGRADGAKNYVIFDENDLRITERIKLFRTPDGQAYGFTLNGKIYLDPRIATAETPIHEYGHLWVEALAEANPEAWEHLKGELEQDTDLVNYVKGRYPDLEGDELWEEVFTHFSGRRGRERMEEERRRMMNEEPDLMGKARVARMFYRLRRALKRLWTMARDLFAGNNARLKTMKAEDFADAMMADLVHGFNPRTGELAEQRIRRMADKYNSKQLVFLNDKMDALEVFDALDIPEEIFEGDMPTQEEKMAFVEEIKQFTEKSYAFYFPPSDKIIIFAERIPSHREEETFFHENIHAILRSWYGASPAPRRIAEAFWDLAPAEGGEVSKSYIEKKYRDTPEKWKEEFFVTWLGRAMAHGSVDEVTNLLQDSGDKSRIESIEHSLGYDRGEETAARGEGTRRTEEDTSRGSQEDGKILQGQRYNRLTSSSDGVPRYQFVGERGARQADLAEERTHRIDNLTVAREMEDAGKDAVAIKLATGWERGGDGKWRYEIPDIDRETVVKGLREPIKAHRKAVDDMERQEERLQGQAFSVSYKIPKRLDSRFTEEEKAKYRQMREKAAALEGEALSVRKEINALKDKVEKEGYETTLGDVLGKDSELIKAYPSLADVKVKVFEHLQGKQGSYSSETNTLELNAGERSIDSVYSTMLHEIQHAIQHIEGFARGGNLGTVLSDNAYLMELRDNLLGTLVDVEKQLKETRDQLAAQDFSRYTKEALTSREANLQLDALNINHTLDDLDNNRISLDIADRYYRRLGGEVEARNVQRRRGYSEEERRRSLAVATEDVGRDEQHFLFGEDESKSAAELDSPNSNDSGYSVNNEAGETLFAGEDGIHYEAAPSRRGKPRKRQGETQLEYVQRLRDWERLQQFLEDHPRPLEPEISQEELSREYNDYRRDWMTRHGLP